MEYRIQAVNTPVVIGYSPAGYGIAALFDNFEGMVKLTPPQLRSLASIAEQAANDLEEEG